MLSSCHPTERTTGGRRGEWHGEIGSGPLSPDGFCGRGERVVHGGLLCELLSWGEGVRWLADLLCHCSQRVARLTMHLSSRERLGGQPNELDLCPSPVLWCLLLLTAPSSCPKSASSLCAPDVQALPCTYNAARSTCWTCLAGFLTHL